MPCVNYGSVQTTGCSGLMNFTDSTTNTPTVWQWDFGDGGTSTIQNPIHTYSIAGTYPVTLIATNTTGSDSITKIITLASVGGPILAFCSPYTLSPNAGYGISNVSFNTISNNSSSSVLSYEDFTCSTSTNVFSGIQYTLNVTTFYGYENVSAWIDYDNDGVFTTSENIAIMAGIGNTLHTALINIPLSGISFGTPLRLRFISDYYNITSSCQNSTYGQCEDYTITILSQYYTRCSFFSKSFNHLGSAKHSIYRFEYQWA